MRASRCAAIAALTAVALATTGCAAMTQTSTRQAPRATAPSMSAVVSKALGSCNLSSTQPGVIAGARALHLETPVSGHPTGVDRATAGCVLDALGMPTSDRKLFAASGATGGSQTVAWDGFSATWSFRDSLTFDVDVYAVA
ncbi:hypothetical protein [Frondihabitans australicus]|uniref:Lipoprotein n=1 Tax=Frondihabitans australicus TaxID=386892 RepID=A0A495IBC5_9MICO|nr:hypothetical protein [Frondihabitans australicus]RKR73229.1 hypothetical protein C8E83_0319 [Frondihabitans australicus]